MQEIIVNLNISAADYQHYYRGRVKYVMAHDAHGRRIQFPANILQQVVQHNGVQGRFAITIDDNNKFSTIKRL